MSRQIRTWVESRDEKTGLGRWDVLINDVPIPGGYVVELPDGGFEAHYPHVEPFVKPTLAEAKKRLEWAPPIMGGGKMHIASEVAADDSAAMISIDEAASRLDMSKYRVNAMVANGKLAARQCDDGEVLVSEESVEKLLRNA